MEKLIGNKNIAVFISGKGTNLKSLVNFSKKTKKFNVTSVISDNKKAKGLLFAKKKKIKCLIVNYKNKYYSEKQIYNFIKKENVSLIALAGFMRILSKKLIKKIKIPIINIHPSLLPKYKGPNTHQRAINNKEKYSGCTVHYVNEYLDSGKIIMQKKVKILLSDNEKSLEKKILKKEHKIYAKVIEGLLN